MSEHGTPSPAPLNPKREFIRGAFWAVGTRWSIKALGFLNTVIMARLLMPEDYGVVAIAMLTVGFIYAFADLGVATALMRKSVLDQDTIDSAWTLKVLQGAAIAGALLLASFWIPVFYDEPRVQTVLRVLAVCVLLEGTSSIGPALAYKSFDFSLEFRVNVISKAVSVLAALGAGIWLRDYRALVIGIAVSYVCTFFLSYALHSFRPRWQINRVPELWAVTKWLMLGSMGGFLMRRSDELIAARIASTAHYGAYHVGADLGRLPVGELGPSLVRAFLPVLASIKSDALRTRAAVLKALAASNALTLPIGFGMAALAVPLTGLVLGNQWNDAVPFVAGFALIAAAQFSISPLNTLLVLYGHTKTQTSVVWIEFAAFVLACIVVVPTFNLMGLVYSRLVAMAVSAVATIAYAQWRCGVSWFAVLKSLYRPLSGAVAMHFVVTWWVADIAPGIQQVLVGASVGALTYTAWMAASWWVAGRPEGLESTLWDAFGSRLKSVT
jgi:lipopolysaccharide exporter